MRHRIHHLWAQRHRNQGGFSTIMVGFLMLAMMLPIAFIAESVLVAGRHATGNALGQESLRAVDSAMSGLISDIRLDAGAVDVGCSEASASTNTTTPYPLQGGGVLNVRVVCAPEGTVTEDERTLNIEAFVPSGVGEKSLGKSRIRLLDKRGGVREPGVVLDICDWRLGKHVGALGACS
jgi:hypothetical protein